jgi:hypothetical protein
VSGDLRYVWVDDHGFTIVTMRDNGVVWINEDAERAVMGKLLGTLLGTIPAAPHFTAWHDIHAIRRMLSRILKIIHIGQRRHG